MFYTCVILYEGRRVIWYSLDEGVLGTGLGAAGEQRRRTGSPGDQEIRFSWCVIDGEKGINLHDKRRASGREREHLAIVASKWI